MRVDIGDTTLWVEQDGDGPPVMVPTGGGVEFYRRTFSPRFRRELHLYFVEMRGTGGSDGSIDGATFASLADDVERVREALGLERVVVLGHSNHGCIALEHGLRHPGGCAGVVSVGSVPDGREALAIGQRRWAEEASADQLDDLAHRQRLFESSGAAMSDDERAIRGYLALAPLGWRDPDLAPPSFGGFPMGAGAYFAWMSAAIASYDGGDRIATLRPSLLAVAGRFDYLCPVETWDDAIGEVPHGSLEVFEASAHNPQVEEQERFDDLVLDFVDACLRR